jgi:hypothetical protein
MNPALPMLFPHLSDSGYRETSPADRRYNCVAWAAGDDQNWWWPQPFDETFWPPDAPRIESVEGFMAAFRTLGYEPCGHSQLEPGFEKVALYVGEDGLPTHAARQLENGRWTSKLGELEDIEHDLDNLEGERYGTIGGIMRRALPDA